MTLESDAKFEEKLALGFKKDMTNEEWWKLWRKAHFLFQKLHEKFDVF